MSGTNRREVTFPSTTAGEYQVLTAAAKTLYTGRGTISCIILTPVGGTVSTVVVYDATSATGTPILTLTATNESVVARFDNLYFTTGLHVAPTGSGAIAYVYANG